LGFDACRRRKPLCQAHNAPPRETAWKALYLKPKSTFLLGACAAAMGVFNASTTGAAILK
jgi:hypothetical protein